MKSILITAGLVLAAATQSPGTGEPERTVSVVAIGASLGAGSSVMLGATVTDGSEAFEDVHTFVDVVAALEPDWDAQNLADTYLFLDPAGKGAKQVEAARDAEPELVLALDFLFWFAYGVRPDGVGRVELLESQGFPLLESLWEDAEEGEQPVVLVSMLPDVRSSPVIPPDAKPTDAELGALNAALAAWGARHANVLVVPVAECLASLRGGDEVRVCATEYAPGDVRTLLLSDSLHPSTRGAALIAGLCLASLDEARRKEGASARVPALRTEVSSLDLRALAEELIAARKEQAKPAAAGG